MPAYIVSEVAELVLDLPPKMAKMDWMSPYIWRKRGSYCALVRGVPCPLGADDPTGIIFCGESPDGIHLKLDAKPAITPGPDCFDAGGVEDPTLARGDHQVLVFYTGVEETRRQGSLLVARGRDLLHLEKSHVALKAPEGAGNIKEATLAELPGGDWLLFYEYAQQNASRIGVARAKSLDGEWEVLPDPFTVREDSWDNWHLSTGPIVRFGDHDPVMFYNGATVDARWRIGWISFAPDFSKVTGRGVEPVLMPPPPEDRAATDIAFAASALVEDGGISLWYSLEDRRLMRARIAVYDRPVSR